jgi:hypothetical protein
MVRTVAEQREEGNGRDAVGGEGWWYGGSREPLSVAAVQNPERARMVGCWNQKKQQASGASALGLAESVRRACTRARSWRDERSQPAPPPRSARLQGPCSGGVEAYPSLLALATPSPGPSSHGGRLRETHVLARFSSPWRVRSALCDAPRGAAVAAAVSPPLPDFRCVRAAFPDRPPPGARRGPRGLQQHE